MVPSLAISCHVRSSSDHLHRGRRVIQVHCVRVEAASCCGPGASGPRCRFGHAKVQLISVLEMQGSEVKGFAPSREPIPDYLPNVTALLPVPTALTPGSDLPSGIQKLHNLTVGCGSYKEYYRQQKAALLSLGALNSSQIDVYFPNITRELVAVAPGHQKPLLPKTGQRPLAADLLNSVAESHITLLEDSLCEVTPRLLQPRDAWLNVSAPVQTLAVDFDVSIALRSIQEARSNHNIVSFVSLDYQGAASEVGLQLEIKLFPDAPRRRQNVVNLEIVDDGYSKYVTLTPSIIRRLDGSEVSVG